MTRKYFNILLLFLLLPLVACAGNQGGTDVVYREVEYEYTVTDASGTMYEIDYLPIESLDLQEMIMGADLVLVGEVVNQEVFGLADLSRLSTVKVLQVSRGKCQEETVRVLHMRTCPIYAGEEYLLVLKSQQPSLDQRFEIMGGHQGIFRQMEGEVELTNADFVEAIEQEFGGRIFTIYDLAAWFKKF